MPSLKIIGFLILEKEEVFKGFSICGRGGHLGHVSLTFYINFLFPFLRRLHMKFGFDWPILFLFEKIFKNKMVIHVYSPGTGTDNTLGPSFFIKIICWSVWPFAANDCVTVFPI